MPQQIGLGGFLAVFFVGWIIYQVATIDSTTPASSNSSASLSETEVAGTTPEKPKSSWTISESIDEMTGKKNVYAISESVKPTKPMGFPHSRVQSWLGVGCDGSSEWAFFGFNQAPNLVNSETQSGYSVITTRIKWDNSIANTRLIQKWGGDSIHFENERAAIKKMLSSSSAMLELDWYGEGSTNFMFPLAGSSAAIAEMRGKCKK